MFGLSDVAARVVLGIISFVVLSAVVIGGYYYWKGSVRDQALEDFNKKQIEQVLKDAADFRNKMNKVVVDQQMVIKLKDDQIKALESKISEINEYLDSNEVKKTDRPASEILKNTIRKLKGTIQ